MSKRNLIIAVIFTAGLFAVQASAQNATSQTFQNTAAITIPDSGNASLYPSNITVSGISSFTRMEVRLNGFSHTFPDDVDIILVGPNGQRAILMSDAGGNPDVTNINLTFSQTSTTPIPDATVLNTGTFRPTNYINEGGVLTDNFPAPGPGLLTEAPADLFVFNGTSPNGVWSLYVVDDAGGDSGSISGGWTLTFTVPQIFTVNSIADTTDGTCDATNCTLREAITAAQNGDLINFSSLFNTPQTINLLTDLPDINRSITIQGKGANLLTVRRDFNAATNFRIFRIFNAVAISGITITGGDIGPAPSFGGGIYSEGLLLLTNVHLEGNAAGSGGGVYLSNADGFFTNCTFSNNRGGIQSGAIFFSGNGRILRIVNSTISANTSGITNVSFSGNSRLEIVNSTIVSNLSGGIMTSALNSGSSATATLRNTIVTGNTTSNFSTEAQNGGTATFQTLGFNLSDNFNGVFTPLASDITSATPRLAPLALYGGQTPTHALLHASPAINAGDASGATTDQRGVDRVTGASADIGAVEMRPVVVNNLSNTGPFSLRNVVTAANSAGDMDDILFDNTIFNTPQTITLTTGELSISNPVNIIAPGANLLTISGNNNSRVFQIFPNTTATLSGMTISGGNGSGGDGGGIFNDGTLTVTHSQVQGNISPFNGGGIGNGAGDRLTVSHSTISGNTAQAGGGAGGGIINNGTLTVTNSTISGNTGQVGGGGVQSQNAGTLNLTSSTITNNRSNAANGIGGINNVNGIANIRNSIIAGNVDNATKPDVVGAGITSLGFNLIGNRGSVAFNQTGDQSGTGASPLNPQLGALQNNGGTTATHALLAGSPALDRGNSSGATSDQRGLTRPFDLPGINNTSDGADIGAFEAQTVPTDVVPTAAANAANVTGAGGTTYNFTVTYTDDTAINVSAIGTGDVAVTNSGGFTAAPTFVSVNNITNGTPRIATYQFTPPGGSWDIGDNGNYTIVMNANQVSDLTGNFVAAGNIGSFTVNIPTPNPVLNGTANGDAFVVTRSGANTVVTQNAVQVLNQPTVDTNSLVINGLGGDDTLTIDATGGNPFPANGIAFDGGANNDSITLQGGNFGTGISTPLNSGSGTLTYSGGTTGAAMLTYANLEPITDTNIVANYTINSTTAPETINVINGPNNTLQVNSGASPTFELINFSNKANVTVNSSDGDDTFNVNFNITPTALTALSLSGGNGADIFNITSTVSPVNLNGGANNDTINFANGATLSGGTADGGSETDSLNYSAYTTSIAVNLGLGSTGQNATLNSNQEVPPNNSIATGTATLSNYNPATRTFDISVTVTDLSPANVTGFHIHRAPTGVNGPIIIDLQPLAPLVPSGTGFTFNATGVSLPVGNEAAFLGGITYINIHTAAFPGGVIRGQVFSQGNLNLPGGTATGTNGISNFENVTGGSGGDSLVGTNGVNILQGGSGSDTLVGGPGNDTLAGDAGADVLVWSNGDNNDLMDGGSETDTVQVNGSVTAGDSFAVSAGAGGRVAFSRTNLVPFSLDIGTTETLTVNGIGGDDTFAVNSLVGVSNLSLVQLSGFDGNDIFNITPDATVGINVNGGLPAMSGDTLNINLTGVTNPVLVLDSSGNGNFTSSNRQTINITSIESAPGLTATNFGISAPATATSGVAFNFTVTARNAANDTIPGYRGTVHFTSTSGGTLPPDYTFVAADNGVHTFSVTLTTLGNQTITATDTISASVNGISGNINVSAAGCPSPLPIAFGQTVNGSLQAGDCTYTDGSFYDAYTFSGTAGQQISIAMNSAQFNAYLFLYQGNYPGGTIAAQDNNGGGGTNARIPATSGFFTLPATGTYTILANSFMTGETGNYSLTLTLNAGCSYSLNPTGNASVTSAGVSSSFNVVTQTGCAWTAVSSNVQWISITPETGSGNGTVNYCVSANGGQQRTGSITVAGQTFNITQAALSPTATTKRIAADFDGDNKSDLSIFRPSPGQWWYQQSTDNIARAFGFGTSTDKIVPADYDGDGKIDIATFTPSTGTWSVLRSSNLTFFAASFGVGTDIPVPADYDGDGTADLAVFRPANSLWFINRTGSCGVLTLLFGLTGDIPVVGDYDGDGMADLAIFRPMGGSGQAEWWIRRSTAGVFATPFGLSTDKPIPGDYTGDGKTDIAFFRPDAGSANNWFILRSENLTFYAAPFGLSTDLPVPGDYDGDGSYDLSVFRPSETNWYILRSSNQTIFPQQFGAAGDKPVASAFIP